MNTEIFKKIRNPVSDGVKEAPTIKQRKVVVRDADSAYVDDPKHPWRRKDPVGLDRVVAIRVEISQADIHRRSKVYREKWIITKDREAILAADGKDLIWGSSKDELFAELRSRNPAPSGFTYVTRTAYQSGHFLVSYTPVLFGGNYLAADDILAAVKAGHVINDGCDIHLPKLLVDCGYSTDEAEYLTRKSKIKRVPLKDNMTLVWTCKSSYSHNARWSIIPGAEDYGKACRTLKHSQRCRTGKVKNGKPPHKKRVITIAHLGNCVREVRDALRSKLSLPYWVRFDSVSRWKGYTANELQGSVDLYVRATRCYDYRKGRQYRSMLTIWADSRNREKTMTETESRLKHDMQQTEYMKKFFEWLDGELAYCQRRKWKFAKDPQEKKAKKKR